MRAGWRLLAGVVVALLAGQTAGQSAAFRAYYLGTIGNLPVQLDLDVSGKRVTGRYFYERFGAPLLLTGLMLAYDEMRVEESTEEGAVTGSFQARLSSSFTERGRSIQGEWASLSSRFPLELAKVADYVKVASDQGGRVEVNSLYPAFLAPGWQAVGATLQEEALARHQDALLEGQAQERTGELWNGWWWHEATEIRFYAEDLLSLLVTTGFYSGGAHPNSFFSAQNVYRDDKGTRVLSLGDLFAPGVAYLAALSELLIAELAAREADWVVNGELRTFAEEDLQAFTLSPAGLLFAFAPYEVGSYAQGPQLVLLPFETLTDVIDPAGPLARFLR